jgi:hypothetical protein
VGTASLFGGRVRAASLETLAATSKPLSAYRVARVIGAQPIQVLTILKSLAPEFVRHQAEGWVLQSDSLRRFLREELEAGERDRRREKDTLLADLQLKPRRRAGSRTSRPR